MAWGTHCNTRRAKGLHGRKHTAKCVKSDNIAPFWLILEIAVQIDKTGVAVTATGYRSQKSPHIIYCKHRPLAFNTIYNALEKDKHCGVLPRTLYWYLTKSGNISLNFPWDLGTLLINDIDWRNRNVLASKIRDKLGLLVFDQGQTTKIGTVPRNWGHLITLPYNEILPLPSKPSVKQWKWISLVHSFMLSSPLSWSLIFSRQIWLIASMLARLPTSFSAGKPILLFLDWTEVLDSSLWDSITDNFRC